MPTFPRVHELRVKTDGQALMLAAVRDLTAAGNAVTVYATNGGGGALSNPITFPTVIYGDTSIYQDADAVATDCEISVSTLGGVPLLGGNGAGGYRYTPQGLRSEISPAPTGKAAQYAAGETGLTPGLSGDPGVGLVEQSGVLTTQIATSVPVYLRQGQPINTASILVAATAAGTPTNQWIAVYTPTLALLGVSGDLTSTAMAVQSRVTYTFTPRLVAPVSGYYWFSIMVKATTVPTLYGWSTANAITAAAFGPIPIFAQTHGATLTNPASAPATIATPTTVLKKPFVLVA